MKCWAKELNDIPPEKKKSVQWKTQSTIHRQTFAYLSPLFKKLKKKTVAQDILEYLSGIIGHTLERDYVKVGGSHLCDKATNFKARCLNAGKCHIPSNGHRQRALADRRYDGGYSRSYGTRKNLFTTNCPCAKRRDAKKIYSGTQAHHDCLSTSLPSRSVQVARVQRCKASVMT